MKHSKLHGVAHNFAASLSGGVSFVVPSQVLFSAVYAEAAATPDGIVVLDLLSGSVTGAFPDGDLAHAAPLLAKAFPAFCAKHGVDHADYRACLARYVARISGNSFVITIEDRSGRRSAREYSGTIGRRLMMKDALGRPRPSQIASPEA